MNKLKIIDIQSINWIASYFFNFNWFSDKYEEQRKFLLFRFSKIIFVFTYYFDYYKAVYKITKISLMISVDLKNNKMEISIKCLSCYFKLFEYLFDHIMVKNIEFLKIRKTFLFNLCHKFICFHVRFKIRVLK